MWIKVAAFVFELFDNLKKLKKIKREEWERIAIIGALVFYGYIFDAKKKQDNENFAAIKDSLAVVSNLSKNTLYLTVDNQKEIEFYKRQNDNEHKIFTAQIDECKQSNEHNSDLMINYLLKKNRN